MRCATSCAKPRLKLVGVAGFDPASSASRTRRIDLAFLHAEVVVATVGFDPTTYRLSGGCSTRLSYAAIDELAPRARIERATGALTVRGSTTELPGNGLVPRARIKRATRALEVRCSVH